MKITFQVSLYPIAKKNFKTPINKFISFLRKKRLEVEVHATSTIGSGDIEEVFAAVKDAYVSAAKSGDAVMVLTVVNGTPTIDELDKLNNTR